jgi:putative ABC transport system permease protein
MFSNYLKVAIRYLGKHKGYTFINVFGLAVGIATCILIMLFVKSEWSFDHFHSKADRIHRAWLQEFYEGEVFTNVATPIPLGPLLQDNLGEVEAVSRVANINAPITYQGNIFNYPVTIADSTFFELFDFELLKGDPNNPYPTKNSLILTEEAATVFFGADSPLGETLELQLGDEKQLFTVTGLARNVPNESSIQFSLLIPFSNAVHLWSEDTRTKAWTSVAVETYLLLKEGVEPAVVQAKIPSITQPQVASYYKPGEYNVSLQPLKDIHLNNALPAGMVPPSNPMYAYILATVGIFILIIACINFVTLSVGRSTTRALEVGVRKVLGAERRQLVMQFWGEALLLTFCALAAGLLLALIFLKPFNQLANRELVLSADAFTILFCFVLLILIGLFAGSYPAMVLSSFRPVQVLKGNVKAGSMGLFGKVLVVGQFVASISMIICTITIGQQLQYLQSKDLGFEREHILVVPTNQPRLEGNGLAARYITELEKEPQVISATNALYSMAESGWMQLGYKDDQGVFRQFRFNAIDPEFIKTMNFELVAGRDFMQDNAADSNSILVNEALVKQYGWEDPIGKKLPGKYPQRIIGVVKDFHLESLHTPIAPAVLALKAESFFQHSTDVTYDYSPRPRVSVKFRGGDPQEHLALLEKNWKSVAGDQEFEYEFLDDALRAAYEQEQRLGSIVKYASILSIFVACMGLFGLATLVVVRRTKEIGVRKVLGADVGTIVALLTKDFVVLVGLAAIVAFPLAWLFLDRWLQDFAYRIDIPLWVFVSAALMVLFVALATVSVQSVKAALINPVKSLRTE